MAFLDSAKGWFGAITGFCSLCGLIGGGAVLLNSYKAKLDGLDDVYAKFDSRIARIEQRINASTQSVLGERGPQGPQGRAGDAGAVGERGPAGPKGDPGVAPFQISEFDKRISALERRAVATAKPGEPTKIASADSGLLLTAKTIIPAGISKTAEGCYFFTPDMSEATITVKVGDRFCTVDGGSAFRVSKIGDDFTQLSSNESPCRLSFSYPCPTYAIQSIQYSPLKLFLATDGTLSASIKFIRRN